MPIHWDVSVTLVEILVVTYHRRVELLLNPGFTGVKDLIPGILSQQLTSIVCLAAFTLLSLMGKPAGLASTSPSPPPPPLTAGK